MKKNDIVSVLLAVYNRKRYIKDAVLSVVNQTYRYLELVIIDDGSSDGTWEELLQIKEKHQKRFVNFTIKKQKNQGICASAINLLKLASGQYCYFMDSDDIIKKDAVYRLHKFLSQNYDYCLAVGDNDYMDEKSDIFYLDKNCARTYNKNKAKYLTRNERLQDLRTDIDLYSSDFGKYSSIIKENYILNGFLVRTKFIKKIGGFKKSAPVFDYYLMLQLAKYSKLKYIDKVLYSYRCHGSNDFSTSKTLSDRMRRTLQYELNLIKRLNLNKMTANARNCIKNKFAHLILTSKIQNILSKK